MWILYRPFIIICVLFAKFIASTIIIEAKFVSLNQTQAITLIDVVQETVDGLSPELLTKAIEPLHLNLNDAIQILKLDQNSGLIPQIGSSEINIPAGVPDEWKKILDGSSTTLPDLLKNNPNFNPIYVAEMQRFEDSLPVGVPDGLSEEVRLQLLRLREMYLEMTPKIKYRYSQGYNSFYFRIGTVPLNLDRYGSKPLQGEIQAIVEQIVAKDIAVKKEYDEREAKAKEVLQEHERLLVQHEKELIAQLKSKYEQMEKEMRQAQERNIDELRKSYEKKLKQATTASATQASTEIKSLPMSSGLTLFNKPKDELTTLLDYVVRGDKDKVEEILQKTPRLLLETGLVTDYSGRQIEGTAYQIALGAEDVSRILHRGEGMAEMIEDYLRTLPNGELAIKNQQDIQFPKGYEEKENERKLMDSAALREVVRAIEESKVAMIVRMQLINLENI